ncbi:SCO family protein [Phenylobacterium sp.]|uniref:SCO family protein n=1 Tax=Phenylobacterium sp. TaxID=1871053 RepID=UPI00286A5A8B|nr:SCO family protein [Phenylobacterium sp.]
MSRPVLIVLAALAAAFALFTGLAVQRGILGPTRQAADIGGPFHLVDQAGRATDEGVLKGRWSAVFFGFTDCPEACPTTLLALGQTEKLLGSKAGDVQTVFISLDPERDTPKVLANYLSNTAFPRRVLGLTGTAAQVAGAAGAYHVFYQKAGEGAGYTINHSTITYLMSPRGRLVCVIPYGVAPELLARMIISAMQQGPGARSCPG